jgi:hypothetical protein
MEYSFSGRFGCAADGSFTIQCSPCYLVAVLKVHQPDVSNLLKGKISKVSITKLIQFAGRLNLDARVKVPSPKIIKNVTASGEAVQIDNL